MPMVSQEGESLTHQFCYNSTIMTASERIISEALTLPTAERLEVIEQLWDSLSASPEAMELTDEQRRELDRRIDEMDANPHGGIPWEDVRKDVHRAR